MGSKAVVFFFVLGFFPGFSEETSKTNWLSSHKTKSVKSIVVEQGVSRRFAWVNLGPDPPYYATNYYGDLSWGPNISFQYQEFSKNNLGWALRLSGFGASNIIKPISVVDAKGDTVEGELSNNLKLVFFGASYIKRKWVKKERVVLFGSLDGGILYYRERLVDVQDRQLLTAFPVALGFSIGFDVPISANLAFGGNTHFLFARTSTKVLETGGAKGEINDAEPLSRFDLTLGFRFNL